MPSLLTCQRRYDMVTSLQGLNVCGMYLLRTSTAFFSLRGIPLLVFFKACTDAGPVDALKVQSSNSNTKVSRVQVHSLSEGPTRGLGVAWLVGRCTFVSQDIKTIARFNSTITGCRFYYGNLYWKRRARLGSSDPVIPPLYKVYVALSTIKIMSEESWFG